MIKISQVPRYWTPIYFLNKIFLLLYEKQYPDRPWLNAGAIHYLEQVINSQKFMVEFGSGRSTVWFSQRVKRLISVEHSYEWFVTLLNQLQRENISNTKIIHASSATQYVAIMKKMRQQIVDVVLVDGIYRDLCMALAMSRVKRGGVIILDNSERYLPLPSHSPEVKSVEKNEKIWRANWEVLKHWEIHHFSNGVFDTIVAIKP